MPNSRLSPSMTRRRFDNGYWYATDLKRFAIQIGVPALAKSATSNEDYG